jgi:hypothetical protein
MKTPAENLKAANEALRVAVRSIREARELMMDAASGISKLDGLSQYDVTMQRKIYAERETIGRITDKVNNAAGRVFRLERAVADRKPRSIERLVADHKAGIITDSEYCEGLNA